MPNLLHTRVISCLAALPLLGFFGCANTAKSTAQHAIRGTLLQANGRPFAEQRVSVTVPCAFNFEKRRDYFGPRLTGESNHRVVTLKTDKGGHFYYRLDPQSYDTTSYILPPLGTCPRNPPKLAYAIQYGSLAYLVSDDHGHTVFKIIPKSGPPKTDACTEHVWGDYKLCRFPKDPESRGTYPGWETSIIIKR